MLQLNGILALPKPQQSNIHMSWVPPGGTGQDLQMYLYHEAHKNWSQGLMLKALGNTCSRISSRKRDEHVPTKLQHQPPPRKRKNRLALTRIFHQERSTPRPALVRMINIEPDRSVLLEYFKRFDFLSIADYIYHLGSFVEWIKEDVRGPAISF